MSVILVVSRDSDEYVTNLFVYFHCKYVNSNVRQLFASPLTK